MAADHVIVTGGLGMVGAFVCRALLASGYRPVIYDAGASTALVSDVVAKCDLVQAPKWSMDPSPTGIGIRITIRLRRRLGLRPRQVWTARQGFARHGAHRGGDGEPAAAHQWRRRPAR